MATARRPFAPVDRSKKFDDTSRRGGTSRLSSMFHALASVRKRRIVLLLLAAWLLYLFFKNIPTDLPPVSERVDTRYGRLRPQAPSPPHDASSNAQEQPGQQYDGPIKFFRLGSTLKASNVERKNNVLFAFSSPQSASPVLTAACAMANYNRTRVHVAIMGRKEVGLADILALNGIQQADCPILWHEAQPDFAQHSTIQRMQVSCEAAVGHIHKALPLRTIFFDSSIREDSFLREAIEGRISSLGLPTLQLPEPDSWMLRLDTYSLRQWDQVQVDILVHVPRGSSGSLPRLLRTLRDADYRGLTLPRITVELPPEVDSFVFDHLSAFRWPPRSSSADSKLTIRHRIDSKIITTAVASSRFIELFYPTRPAHSHVLILSADAELSSSYYQSLMYMIMEYKYGGQMVSMSQSLLGISLTPPQASSKASPNSPPVSLWQAPSADAALYFGDEWVQLHEFVKYRLSSDPQLSQTIDSEVSLPQKWPTWLKLAIEWMQIRALFMAYTEVKDVDSPIVTMHSELHQVPEEYASPEPKTAGANEALKLGEDGNVLTAEGVARQEGWENLRLSTPSLVGILDGLASSGHPTAYNYTGDAISWKQAKEQALEYSERFSKVIGKCPAHAKGASLEKDGFPFLFCENQADTRR